MFVRVFALSFIVTVVSLVVALIYGGPEALLLAAILGVLEVSLSFDNAVVNASVLQRLSAFWQRIFLTVGVLIAVFGMRLLFPLVIVAITAHLDPVKAFELALNPPPDGAAYFSDGRPSYETLLNEANPKIAAFGGMFLLMLFLDFITSEREITWLTWVERPLARLGRFPMFSTVVSLLVLVGIAGFTAPDDRADVVMVAGALGMVTYILVNGLSEALDNEHEELERTGPGPIVVATGKAAFFVFLYLEVLDASFSFDGVIGAFAITADPIIIALGLGLIGSMFVRSITVYLVRQGTLSEYVHLEHGAHWAIGALAVVLLYSTGHHLNEVVTGMVGVTIIAAAFVTSVVHNRRRRTTDDDSPTEPSLTAASSSAR
ncbi:DUF475 domain-containing protein [Nocardia wallacei]|uniref:DUF475 domain-containing protein n=1 Tax=Nocardia wallacei TaxID=480035 RepID=UPI002455C70F|nr:DUF475 domain-containing protein [Nocardia wallacei]